MIYFIGQDWDHPVKIGKANNVKKRIGQLQVGNPCELKILFTLSGSGAIEKQFHNSLKEHNIRGEWFNGRIVSIFLDNLDIYDDKVVGGEKVSSRVTGFHKAKKRLDQIIFKNQREIVRCPFCNDEDARPFNEGDGSWVVRCQCCRADGPFAFSAHGAVLNWNLASGNHHV